ncbi:hypothetical protein ANN_08146 [Periplaneta americana]|uniref:RING-type domain-containing protein n=1 Tax=Periplaneta americana TaxID=6978 RepID=A0ABQ8T266_PERAM|nr:hypothetical protein ANN_08146 [Periplaneta americana]
MDFIHCNSCFLLPSQPNGKNLSLTSCGHVYCENCIKPGVMKKCTVCDSTFTTIPLNSELRADIQEYFKSTEDVLKRALEITTFQGGHRKRIMSYFNSVVIKYKAAKREIVRLTTVNRKLEKENIEMKQQLAYYKQKEQKFISPVPNYSSQPNHTNATPLLIANPKNMGFSSNRIPLSQNSTFSMIQQSTWGTPRRLTLRKVSPSTSGSSTLSSLSPSTPRNILSYPGQQRGKSNYSSFSNTPTSGASSHTPESLTRSPLISETRSHSGLYKYGSINNTSKMISSLTLTQKPCRENYSNPDVNSISSSGRGCLLNLGSVTRNTTHPANITSSNPMKFTITPSAGKSE